MVFTCEANDPLWKHLTIFGNAAFNIVQIVVTFLEVMAILLYVKINKRIASNSKNRKAADAVILPMYHKPWSILIICETLLLSTDIIVTYLVHIDFEYIEYIIIVINGFLHNTLWYYLLYLLIFLLLQRSGGQRAWNRASHYALIVSFLTAILISFMFILPMPHGFSLSSYIAISLTMIEMIIFVGIFSFMYQYPRRRFKKALFPCILYAFSIHLIWFIGNILSMIENVTFLNLNFCVFWAIDSIRQLSFPLVLFYILQRDSQYWRQLGRLIMQTNIPRESIWDKSVNTGANTSSLQQASHDREQSWQPFKEFSKSKGIDSNKITFDQVNDVISMRVPVFDFARLNCNMHSKEDKKAAKKRKAKQKQREKEKKKREKRKRTKKNNQKRKKKFTLSSASDPTTTDTTTQYGEDNTNDNDNNNNNNSNESMYLGIGTSAAVTLGCYQGKKVAIKSIVCDELDFEIVHLFYKEALLSLSLKNHINIVRFLGVAIQPPELCLVYEYCSHRSLTNVLRNVYKYDLNYEMMLNFALDIACGMHYLHEEGIVHRDLKTENILVSKSKRRKRLVAKVADFGLARRVVESGITDTGHRSRVKHNNTAIGAANDNNNNDNNESKMENINDSLIDSPISPDLWENNSVDTPSTIGGGGGGGDTPTAFATIDYSNINNNNSKETALDMIEESKEKDSQNHRAYTQPIMHDINTTPTMTSVSAQGGPPRLNQSYDVANAKSKNDNNNNNNGANSGSGSSDDDRSHISRKGVKARYNKRLNSYDRLKPRKMTAEVGSVAFMAPELLENIDFNNNGQFSGLGGPTLMHATVQYAFSVDIFSYGVILWEIITRDEIHSQYKSVDEMKKQVLNGIHPKIPSWCPKEYGTLMERCWALNPVDRPPFSYIKERLKRMMKLHQTHDNVRKAYDSLPDPSLHRTFHGTTDDLPNETENANGNENENENKMTNGNDFAMDKNDTNHSSQTGYDDMLSAFNLVKNEENERRNEMNKDDKSPNSNDSKFDNSIATPKYSRNDSNNSNNTNNRYHQSSSNGASLMDDTTLDSNQCEFFYTTPYVDTRRYKAKQEEKLSKHESKSSWISRAFSSHKSNASMESMDETKILWLDDEARTVKYKVTSTME